MMVQGANKGLSVELRDTRQPQLASGLNASITTS